MRIAVIWVFVFVSPVLTWAQSSDNSNEVYQSALKAYLEGDFDQAILLDTRAIQADANNRKASDLLAVLVGEKEQNQKTEIWIGSDKALNQVPLVSSPIPQTLPAASRVRHVSKTRSHKAPPLKAAAKEVDNSALEARVETILLLMGRNASDQYKELTAAQMDTMKRMEENRGQIKDLQNELNRTVENSETRFGWFAGFQWLALITALLALWMAYRARVEIKRLRLALEGTPHIGGDKGNVLPLDGTFR